MIEVLKAFTDIGFVHRYVFAITIGHSLGLGIGEFDGASLAVFWSLVFIVLVDIFRHVWNFYFDKKGNNDAR